MAEEPYSRQEVLAARDGLPDRGALCHHCDLRIPQFADLSEEDERRVFELIHQNRNIMAIQELRAATGSPLVWAEIWVEHRGRPRARPNETLPCPFCGKPLRTSLAKQCRFCLTEWHDPGNPTRLGAG